MKKEDIKLIREKTTVSITFRGGEWFMHSGYLSGCCSVSFYGTYRDEWQKRWNKFFSERKAEAQKTFENEKQEKIKKIESELLITVDSWFSKKRKVLEEKLVEEKNKEFTVSEWSELTWIYEFLPDDCVRISENIYEIISPPQKNNYMNHQPKPEVKCEGEDTHEKGACPALADALSSPASTEDWANNWEKNLAQIIVNCKEKKISPEEAVVQTRSLLSSHDRQLRQRIASEIEEVIGNTDWANDWGTGINKLAKIITNL